MKNSLKIEIDIALDKSVAHGRIDLQVLERQVLRYAIKHGTLHPNTKTEGKKSEYLCSLPSRNCEPFQNAAFVLSYV